MAEDYGENVTSDYDYNDAAVEKKDNKIWIIIAVVLIVLCCCCLLVAGVAWWLYENGDEIFGLAAQFSTLLL